MTTTTGGTMYDHINPPRPYARTVTRRRRYAQDIRGRMAAYKNLIGQDGTETLRRNRINTLLWTIAFAERALALETRSYLGDMHATGFTVLAAQTGAKGPVTTIPMGKDA